MTKPQDLLNAGARYVDTNPDRYSNLSHPELIAKVKVLERILEVLLTDWSEEDMLSTIRLIVKETI
jgi:hypothetical protein